MIQLALPASSLRSWASRYLATRALSAKAAYQIRHSVNLFVAWRGADPNVDEVDEVTFSTWLAELERTHAMRSVQNHRANLLGVLRLAADGGVRANPNPRLIRRIVVPPPDPIAWTAGEFRALLSAAEKLPGKIRNRPRLKRSHYLLAMISTAFDTGARLGDLQRIEHEWIDAKGRLRFRISKTSTPHIAQLSVRTMALLESIKYRRPLKWMDRSVDYYQMWRDACNRAGVRHGATQQVRRTAATVVWRDDPAQVSRFLGHKTATMWRHYVDQVQAATPIRPREFWKQTAGSQS